MLAICGLVRVLLVRGHCVDRVRSRRPALSHCHHCNLAHSAALRPHRCSFRLQEHRCRLVACCRQSACSVGARSSPHTPRALTVLRAFLVVGVSAACARAVTERCSTLGTASDSCEKARYRLPSPRRSISKPTASNTLLTSSSDAHIKQHVRLRPEVAAPVRTYEEMKFLSRNDATSWTINRASFPICA